MTATWREIATGAADLGDRPLLVVHGNCQAEALRVLCSAALGDDVTSVRLPPVFELEAADMDDFVALIRRTSYFVTQPIVDDYRGLPLGSAQVRALLPESATSVTVPVMRWAALHPTQVIVRAPGVGDPPVVPYHDLRVLVAASRGDRTVDLVQPSSAAVRAVRDISRDQLRIRQDHHDTVDAVAEFEAAGGAATWTINHPQNEVLRGVAARILERLGVAADVADPGRVLLSTTMAPVSGATLAALDLKGEQRSSWVHQGRDITEEEVSAGQLAWYAENPQVVAAGLRRHAQTLNALGIAA